MNPGLLKRCYYPSMLMQEKENSQMFFVTSCEMIYLQYEIYRIICQWWQVL